MEQSSSPVRRAERPILAPAWLVAVLAAIVVVGLVLIYPRYSIEGRLADSPRNDLSAAYLVNLLRSDPDNPHLRVLLAEQEITAGDTAAARDALRPVIANPAGKFRGQALQLQVRLLEIEYHRLPVTAEAERQVLRSEIISHLRVLAELPFHGSDLLAMAGKARAFGDPQTAMVLYKRGGEDSKSAAERLEMFDAAAREALAQGDYRSCAELHLMARDNASGLTQARQQFHAALLALQSGNMTAEALALGENSIGNLIDDPDTLFLLTNLARAAGKPASADHWVRKLLKISLERRWQAMQLARAWGEGAFRPVSQQDPPHAPGIPFDEKVYRLGYDVFLENRKLEDAWQVAASAVRQQPDDMAWRERLARVAEWTRRPQQALDNWLLVARRSGLEEAWQAVLRLAPGLFEDRALIAGLEHQLAGRPADVKLISEIAMAYERLAAPREGLDMLERHYRQTPSPVILVQMAGMAERADLPDRALGYWERLFRDPAEITPRRALRAALIAIMRGRDADGLSWLVAAQANVGHEDEKDAEFWRISAELADQQNNELLAIRSFIRLIEKDDATTVDFDSLIRLLDDTQPTEAARVAVLAWQRFDLPQYLVQALTIHAGRNQWQEMGQLLGQLDARPDAERKSLLKLRRIPEFLRLSGLYKQNKGRFGEARRDFEAGLMLSPDSDALQQALIWLFIDGNDAVALKKLLATREAEWSRNPAMHDSLAAAWQALSLPQTAISRYMQPRLAQHSDDFLWLMNFADALDQNQQSDRAWRLRRILLSSEWQANRQGKASLAEARRRWLTEEGMEQVRRIARTRLMLTQRPGDVGNDVLRELMRLDRDAAGSYSNAAAETAIGWLQDAGQYNAERGFLWQQYAKSRSSQANRPLWAEITMALAEQDKAEIGQLLDRFDERLPRYDRINAARAVGDLRLAQTAAFEAQEAQHQDDPLHLQLTENLLEFSDHAGVQVIGRSMAGLRELENSEQWHIAISPRLSLDLQVGTIKRMANDPAILLDAPDEQFQSVRVNWLHEGNHQTHLRFDHRNSLSEYNTVQFQHLHRIDNRLSVQFDLASNLPTGDSLLMRLAGVKDEAKATLRYQPTRLDTLSVEQGVSLYQFQGGEQVGRGRETTVTYAHLLRQEAPDLEFSAFWSHFGFSDKELAINQVPAALLNIIPDPTETGPLLPQSFNLYGVRASTDVRFEEQYTRRLRPYASAAWTRHTVYQNGYDIRIGAAGSVLGADHLSLTWGMDRTGKAIPGLNRTIQLNYRLHF